MVKIDFQLGHIPTYDEYSPMFVKEFPAKTFKGKQVFLIDGKDFSNDDTSVLYFAWHLRQLQQWIAIGVSPYEIAVEHAPSIVFSKEDNKIEVKRVLNGLNRAVVEEDDLVDTVKPYCKRVFRFIAAQYPPLEADPQLSSWWFRDFLSAIPCKILRCLGDDPKAGYEVIMPENGKTAILHCPVSLTVGEQITAQFGAAQKGNILLSAKGRD